MDFTQLSQEPPKTEQNHQATEPMSSPISSIFQSPQPTEKPPHSQTTHQPVSKETAETDQVIEKRMMHPEDIAHSPTSFSMENKPSSAEYFSSVEKKARDLFEQNLFSQAETMIHHLHHKGLGSAVTYCLLGNCHYQKNQFKKALLAYKKSLEINASHIESLLNLSLLRFDLGDYEQGSWLYNKAMQVISDQTETEWKTKIAEGHVSTGICYFNKGYYHEALLEFLKAKPHQKNSVSFELQVIQCLWKLNRKKEALTQTQTLKKKHPLNVSILVLLGEFYFELKRVTHAILEWERVLRLDPKNKVAIQWLSKVQYIQSVKGDHFA